MRSFLTLTSLRRSLLGGAAAAALAALPAHALPVFTGNAVTNAGGVAPVVSTAGATVNVNLNAARTILDWSNFNVAPGETANFYFDQRGWIALNRVTGSQISINGAVNGFQAAGVGPGPSGGNVWFYSPSGVAFGSNARVDVAGLLATSAAVNQPAFLNPGNINIPFTGTGSGGPVTVAAGAQINGAFHVALVAPRVTTAAGAIVTGQDAGSVLYGAADSFEVQLFAQNSDFTIFTFLLPSAAAGTAFGAGALTIAGQTTAGTIYLAAYSRAAVAGTVINAPGLLTATSSIAAYGQVTITTGRDIILGQPGPGDNAPLANLNPGLQVGSAQIGEINADGNVNVILTGTNYDQGPLGNLTATKIRAGQGLVIGGAVVTIPGGVSSGDAGVNARGANIVAGGQLTIPTITAAGDLFFGSRFNGVTFDRATSGGNLSILNAQGLTGNLLSSVGSLTISAGGPINVANVSGSAVMLSVSGAVNIPTLAGSTSVTVGSNGAQAYGSVTGGTVALTTGSTVNVANLTGTAVDIGSVDALTVGSAVGGSSLILRSNSAIDAGSVSTPTLTISGLTVRLGAATVGGEALVRTTQMELLTSFTAGNLTIEGASGRFALGGTEEPGLTNAELQRIRVTGSLNLYAGQRAPTAGNPNPQYGDFEVRDLTLDATRIPRLNLFAHSGRQVSILGNVQVTGSGGILQIGETAPDALFKPGRILISGALGAAQGDALAGFTDVSGFASVQLNAADDILIGSTRFIDLIDDASIEDIDIARGLPPGVAPQGDEVGRLFLVAGRAELSAGGRILQQNTAALGGQESGFYLTGQGVPITDALLVIGGSPDAVDLFGALGGETGLISGRQAAFSRRITAGGESAFSDAVRINGCPLGIGCAVATPSTSFRIESFQPAAAAAAIDPPVLTARPRVDDEDDDDEAVVTGTGNEEIWRRDR